MGFAMFLIPAGAYAKVASCQRELVSMAMAPDNARVAIVHENLCSDGAFVTTFTSSVRLVPRDQIELIQLGLRPSDADYSDVVFAFEHHRRDDRPVMRWLSASRLEITIPNKSLIGLKKQSYDGIEIVLRFDPNDPAERERWLKSLGLAQNGKP